MSAFQKASSDLLASGNPVPKYNNTVVEIPLSGKWTPDQLKAQYENDCVHMKPTQLGMKYKLTYDSWRNMKQRAKKGYIIHQSFADFVGFLKIMGPRTSKNYTLDRLNNDDPEYAPGKVEWRDKFAQNSNKSNNVVLTDKLGVSHTVAQWAAIKKVSTSSLYKHKSNGWNDHEAIHGKEKLTADGASEWADTPWPRGKEIAWENHYQDRMNQRQDLISREQHFYDTASSKFKYASSKLSELAEEIEGIQTNTGYWINDHEFECGVPPAHLLERFEKLQSMYIKWEPIHNSAKAHLEHTKNLRKFVECGEGHPSRERRRFLMLNPKPPRLLPVAPLQILSQPTDVVQCATTEIIAVHGAELLPSSDSDTVAPAEAEVVIA